MLVHLDLLLWSRCRISSFGAPRFYCKLSKDSFQKSVQSNQNKHIFLILMLSMFCQIPCLKKAQPCSYSLNQKNTKKFARVGAVPPRAYNSNSHDQTLSNISQNRKASSCEGRLLTFMARAKLNRHVITCSCSWLRIGDIVGVNKDEFY